MSGPASAQVLADRADPTPTPEAARRRTHRRLAVVLTIQGVLLIGYWTAWFIDHSLVAADTGPEYESFEAAFPLPDALVALFSLLAARDLRAHRARGVVFVLLGAGAGLFLGLIDLAYDLQNGIWAEGLNGAIEMVIVVTILVSATGYALWGWSSFRRLTQGREL